MKNTQSPLPSPSPSFSVSFVSFVSLIFLVLLLFVGQQVEAKGTGGKCAPGVLDDRFNIDFKDLVKNYQDLEPSEDLKEFDKKHPYYIKYCAESRYSNKRDRPAKVPAYGETTGHFANFLKGVCKDESANYPRLKICDDQDVANGQFPGVGISVNRPFKNANFVVVPKDLFFDGGMTSEDTFTEEEYQKLLGEAEDIYKGISFHRFYHMPPEIVDRRNRMRFYKELIGSDYALSLNRYSYCLNIPLNRELMGEVVNYLNKVNEDYRLRKRKRFLGKTFYRWDALKDNCVHLTANLASFLGIVPRRSTDKCYVWQAMHLTVPANVLMELTYRTNEGEIDPRRIYKDRKMRDIFLKYNWIPNQYDSLTEIIGPTSMKDNEVYDPDPKIYAFAKKWTNPYTVKGVRRGYFKDIFSDRKFFKRKENQEFFRKKYVKAKEILQEMRSAGRNEEKEMEEFTQKFEAYLDQKLAELDLE